MISSYCYSPLEQNIISRAREQIAAQSAPAIKIARNTFPNQGHSYTVMLDGKDVKLYINLRKSEQSELGSGEFKVSKLIKQVGTGELAVRSILKHAKNGITTEDLVFRRIKDKEGSGKQFVLHASVFAFRRKNSEIGVSCISEYCPGSFNELTREDKRRAMPAIARGIEYLHTVGIVHCDINGKNILIKDDLPVIIDLEGALVFDLKTGRLDAEFSKKRTEKRPYFLYESAPPDARKAVDSAFDALEFERAKKWDIFAFGLLVNYAYNLGIVVEHAKTSPKASKHGYIDTICETVDCDYEVYKAPSEIQDNEKPLVSAILKCLQGDPISWSEIHESFTY